MAKRRWKVGAGGTVTRLSRSAASRFAVVGQAELAEGPLRSRSGGIQGCLFIGQQLSLFICYMLSARNACAPRAPDWRVVANKIRATRHRNQP